MSAVGGRKTSRQLPELLTGPPMSIEYRLIEYRNYSKILLKTLHFLSSNWCSIGHQTGV